MDQQKSKRTSRAMAKVIQEHHENVTSAAHAVLASAGLTGVKVHSIRYSVDSSAMSSSPCNPPCSGGQTCTWVIGPNGGEWECV